MLEIAQECAQNNVISSGLLKRQKMTDHLNFSGDLTEWRIFISEFRRSQLSIINCRIIIIF